MKKRDCCWVMFFLQVISVRTMRHINSKDAYAVIGCGPVGLMTIIAAKHLGAEKLFAIDPVPERLAMAKKFGAVPLNPSTYKCKEEILDSTHGRGADAVMEVVGSRRKFETGD